MTGSTPYRSTAVFDEQSLPAALQKEHRTKAGTWGVIRVLEGKAQYRVLDPFSEAILDAEHPGLVKPEQPHMVTPLGAMQLQVDFYDHEPEM